MGNLFGKKEKSHGSHSTRVTDQDRAVLQLKQQRDKLKQYQKKIVIQQEKERLCAKQLLKDGKKDKAKLLLRKKKFQEGLLTKTDNQLDNIDKMIHDVEFAQIEMEVVRGLERGNASLKKMHEVMSLDDVERIMDETKDAVEYQREIDDLLSGGLTSEDEDDVLAELEAITKEALPDVPPDQLPDQLPDVPEDKIEEKQRKEIAKERQPVLAS